MKKIILVLFLVSTQIFAQQKGQQSKPEHCSIQKAKPKSSFNHDVFQKAADQEMKRVNQEFAWIAKRERDRKAKFKKSTTKPIEK